LKRAVLVGLALLIAGAAPAEEMKSPQISLARVDWDAAAASLAERSLGAPAETFAKLNVTAEMGFPGIANSTVPVLLPFDIDGFAKELAANPGQSPDKMVNRADRFMRSGFQATKFFLTGPAGYDAAFALTLANVPTLSDIRYADPVYVLFSGLGMTYSSMSGPTRGQLAKALQEISRHPRYLHESYIRYSFERYGAICGSHLPSRHSSARENPYLQTGRPRHGSLPARAQARRGTPAADNQSMWWLERPKGLHDFSYFSPGLLIPIRD
jgi:hypothetical protein